MTQMAGHYSFFWSCTLGSSAPAVREGNVIDFKVTAFWDILTVTGGIFHTTQYDRQPCLDAIKSSARITSFEQDLGKEVKTI